MIDVEEEKENSKGTLRLRVVAYTSPGCSREVCEGWVSKKLFEFRGAAPGAIAPSVQTSKVRRVSPPPPPIHTGTVGTKKTVTGKHGALLRKGCELTSIETGISLDQGDLCYVSQEDVNEQNIVRAHVVLRSAKGGPWESVDGWCTAKFLTGSDEEEPLPEVGSKPIVSIKFPPCTDTGRVLLFPGQGAQKVGMLAPYEDVAGVKEMFADASEVFGRDLLELIQKGPEQDLNDTRFSQVCVFLTSMAAVAKLHQDDPTALQKVTHTAGFSLGEYSALTFAGVMDIATAVRLLKVRSDAMGAACDLAPSGMMTVVGYEDDALQSLLPDGVSVANQLFPKGRVVAGPRDALKTLEAAVKAQKKPGTKTIMQPVSGAFHSPFMASAADALREALDGVSLKAPSRTVYSNVTARPHASDPVEIKDALCQQLTAGVLWEDTIVDMIKADIDQLYEPAPGKQLTSMMRRISQAHHPKMKNV
jgi:[acyl-carrier-protein] S-malonyltransferase